MNGHFLLLRHHFSELSLWGKSKFWFTIFIVIITIPFQFIVFIVADLIIEPIYKSYKRNKKVWNNWGYRKVKAGLKTDKKVFENLYSNIGTAHSIECEICKHKTLYMNHIEVKTGPLPHEHGTQYEYQCQKCALLENDYEIIPFGKHPIKEHLICWSCGGEMRRDKKLLCRSCYYRNKDH